MWVLVLVDKMGRTEQLYEGEKQLFESLGHFFGPHSAANLECAWLSPFKRDVMGVKDITVGDRSDSRHLGHGSQY